MHVNGESNEIAETKAAALIREQTPVATYGQILSRTLVNDTFICFEMNRYFEWSH